MIYGLLIQITRTPQLIRKETAIAGESIRIGRGPTCQIRLPDHRVNLLHAVVRRHEDGILSIEGEEDAILRINGFLERNAALSTGTRVEIGPYVLMVEPDSDRHEMVLSVEMMDQEQVTLPTAPVTLETLGWSKRKLGFQWATMVLLCLLVLPWLSTVSSARVPSWMTVALTEWLSPGALSSSHRMFSAQCSACHQQAFQVVADKACLKCHKQVAKHLAKEDLSAKVFQKVRCADCHSEHQGKARNAALCVTCHGDIKSRNPGASIGNVHDFVADHPPFHLTLLEGKKATRVPQGKNLVQKPGLKFSHKIHLDPKGLETPLGDTVMTCQDCHKIEESGMHFAPMTMPQTCQQSHCHKIYFVEPVEGKVPHGSVSRLMMTLREFYWKWLTNSPINLTAACQQDNGTNTKSILACSRDLATRDATKFFGGKLNCAECHEISPTGDQDIPWQVAPLSLTRDWQPGAVFKHSGHETIPCTDCHDQRNAKTSAEVTMPTIEKCRECHAGDHAANGKIQSGCDSCHQFHRGRKEP